MHPAPLGGAAAKEHVPLLYGHSHPGNDERHPLQGWSVCAPRASRHAHHDGQGECLCPQNVVNQYMYKNYQLCTLEELASDITFVPKTSKKPGTAHVQVGSLAYETLLDNLANGAWQEELPHIEVEDIFEPGRNHTVQITEKMGRQLYSKLEGPLKEAAESFIDLNDFNAEIVRADGYEAFDSPKGIHGAIIGSEIVPSKKLQQTRMMTEACFHIKARLTYILF